MIFICFCQVCEAVPPVTMSTILLEESNRLNSPIKNCTNDRLSPDSPSRNSKKDVLIGKRESLVLYPLDAVDTSRSRKLKLDEKNDDDTVMSSLSGDAKSKALVLKKSNKETVKSPVEEKRVFVSQAQKDRKKMARTAGVFKRMGMASHVRKGDFKDTTQKTPVLIPLHKVLATDKPEETMSSYIAVKDVYHQKTKYANPVTGFSRAKFVPLFARTTLVEHNGVTPGNTTYFDLEVCSYETMT